MSRNSNQTHDKIRLCAYTYTQAQNIINAWTYHE
jgi:hypothetical protein